MSARNSLLLPHLCRAAREAREAGGLTPGQVAVHVKKTRGRVGVADSTVNRFENGHHWPKDPDAIVHAYAQALGIRECDLWERAIALLCNRR